MTKNDYGYRYPGGHSVIDGGFVPDETAMPKGTKKSNTRWRVETKPVKFEKLKVGDRVKYGIVGEGTVADISDGKVYVSFDDRKGTPRPFKKATAEKNMKVLIRSTRAKTTD